MRVGFCDEWKRRGFRPVKPFSIAVVLPVRSKHVSTFAIYVQSERFLSAFVRADTLAS